MKRAIAILVALFYIIPTIGFSMDVHWCGKKISSVSFNPCKPAKCSTCKTAKGCCKTTHTVVKLKDNQHNSGALKVASGSTIQNTCYVLHIPHASLSVYKTSEYLQAHSPPLIGKQPVYLANSVFRV